MNKHKPVCEEIIPGTDDRFRGDKSPIKTMKIDCSTCNSSEHFCKDEEFNEDLSEYAFCIKTNYFFWYPKKTIYFCKGCRMYGSIGGYQNTNEFDFPYIKCCKHSEPCWRNHLDDPKSQVFITRKDDWNVVRCDREGNEIPWEYEELIEVK